MATLSLLEPEAKRRVGAVVTEIEEKTSAEIVVTLRLRSGDYRHVDGRVGVTALAVALLIFLFHPEPFDTRFFPLVALAVYLGGATFCRFFEPLRRLLTPPAEREASVLQAARAAFYENGVAGTKKRVGVLVFVSVFERRVELVPDIGFPQAATGEPFQRATKRLTQAIASGLSVEDFERALRELGKVLAEVLPRQTDDENELPDEVRS
jgi:putative membrane protein